MKVFKLKGLTMYPKIEKKNFHSKNMTGVLTTSETKQYSRMFRAEGLTASHRESTARVSSPPCSVDSEREGALLSE